ncbi:MAG: Grx4 family monothiol glutaredoxin [Simkaniaceae bacterium]
MHEILAEIKEEIQNHAVILYMKGSKVMPMCGFSGRVVDLLKSYHVDFETRDVLKDDKLRQGIKEYSNWPTLPQLYIRGEFIGGCDIISELHSRGELKNLLQIKS